MYAALVSWSAISLVAPTVTAFRSMHFQHAFGLAAIQRGRYDNIREDKDDRGSPTSRFQSLYGYAASLLDHQLEVNRWQLEGESQLFSAVLFYGGC